MREEKGEEEVERGEAKKGRREGEEIGSKR